VRIAVTGGGSGGHIFPALAVAERLRELGHEVSYVGARGGMEEKLVPESGVPFFALPAGKYNRRTLQPREAYKAVSGLFAARRLLARIKPQAVLSSGGFAGFPLAMAAEFSGVPVVILEQNAVLGLANRWLSGRAAKIALAVEVELGKKLRQKSIVVGMPVRESRIEPSLARRRLSLDPRLPLLLVMGGSQGSLALNRTLPKLLEPLLDRWQVLHQTGQRGYQETLDIAHGLPNYHLAPFVDAPLAWSAADAAITRGGAMTLAEGAFYGVPLLILPLPRTVDGGAQERNARFYASRNAALSASQDDRAAISAAIGNLDDPDKRRLLQKAISELSPAGARERLTNLLLEVAR